jgi:hypothetical protein
MLAFKASYKVYTRMKLELPVSTSNLLCRCSCGCLAQPAASRAAPHPHQPERQSALGTEGMGWAAASSRGPRPRPRGRGATYLAPGQLETTTPCSALVGPRWRHARARREARGRRPRACHKAGSLLLVLLRHARRAKARGTRCRYEASHPRRRLLVGRRLLRLLLGRRQRAPGGPLRRVLRGHARVRGRHGAGERRLPGRRRHAGRALWRPRVRRLLLLLRRRLHGCHALVQLLPRRAAGHAVLLQRRRPARLAREALLLGRCLAVLGSHAAGAPGGCLLAWQRLHGRRLHGRALLRLRRRDRRAGRLQGTATAQR